MTPADFDRLIKYHKAMIEHHRTILGRFTDEKKRLLAKQAAIKKKRDEKFATEETTRIINRIKQPQ